MGSSIDRRIDVECSLESLRLGLYNDIKNRLTDSKVSELKLGDKFDDLNLDLMDRMEIIVSIFDEYDIDMSNRDLMGEVFSLGSYDSVLDFINRHYNVLDRALNKL